jgi:hypothetical protein
MPIVDSTICPFQIERNGYPAELRMTTKTYLDGPFDQSRDPLIVLEPGQTRTFHISGLSCVYDFKLQKVVKAAEPGRYAVRFRYHYTGPDNGRTNVLHERVNSNLVTFELVDGQPEQSSVATASTADARWVVLELQRGTPEDGARVELQGRGVDIERLSTHRSEATSRLRADQVEAVLASQLVRGIRVSTGGLAQAWNHCGAPVKERSRIFVTPRGPDPSVLPRVITEHGLRSRRLRQYGGGVAVDGDTALIARLAWDREGLRVTGRCGVSAHLKARESERAAGEAGGPPLRKVATLTSTV